MTTVKLKGAGARNWFAEQLVADHGPDEARARTCGNMRKAVDEVIARQPWLVTENGHVVPLGDRKLHETTGGDCWCNPTDDDGVTVHHSLDQREMFERGELKPA